MPLKTLLFIFGTRPEAIKLAPLILRLQKNPRLNILVCSTGQHHEMLVPILQFFKIKPDFNLKIMKPGQSLAALSANAINEIQKVIESNGVDAIVVQGDTTSSFIGGLVAFYNKVDVIHVEAGLRSNDILSPFPEEFNRKALSLISNLHLAPTAEAKKNLIKEGVSPEDVYVTGNTGIDALFEVRTKILKDSNLANQIGRQFDFLNTKKRLVLVTLHRRESFAKNIQVVIDGIATVAAQRTDVEFLIPVHLNPDVRRIVSSTLGARGTWLSKELNGTVTTDAENRGNANIWLCDPIDYIPFVYLMHRSYFIITDSGGIQEEAPSLGKPVLIARENTERPEALSAGTSCMLPLEQKTFVPFLNNFLDDELAYGRMSEAKNPFGDGRACEKIEGILLSRFKEEKREPPGKKKL